MVNIEELYGIMGKRRVSKAQLARVLGVSNVTIYKKFNKKKFNTDEVPIIAQYLNIPDNQITDIFFSL